MTTERTANETSITSHSEYPHSHIVEIEQDPFEQESNSHSETEDTTDIDEENIDPNELKEDYEAFLSGLITQCLQHIGFKENLLRQAKSIICDAKFPSFILQLHEKMSKFSRKEIFRILEVGMGDNFNFFFLAHGMAKMFGIKIHYTAIDIAWRKEKFNLLRKLRSAYHDDIPTDILENEILPSSTFIAGNAGDPDWHTQLDDQRIHLIHLCAPRVDNIAQGLRDMEISFSPWAVNITSTWNLLEKYKSTIEMQKFFRDMLPRLLLPDGAVLIKTYWPSEREGLEISMRSDVGTLSPLEINDCCCFVYQFNSEVRAQIHEIPRIGGLWKWVDGSLKYDTAARSAEFDAAYQTQVKELELVFLGVLERAYKKPGQDWHWLYTNPFPALTQVTEEERRSFDVPYSFFQRHTHFSAENSEIHIPCNHLLELPLSTLTDNALVFILKVEPLHKVLKQLCLDKDNMLAIFERIEIFDEKHLATLCRRADIPALLEIENLPENLRTYLLNSVNDLDTAHTLLGTLGPNSADLIKLWRDTKAEFLATENKADELDSDTDLDASIIIQELIEEEKNYAHPDVGEALSAYKGHCKMIEHIQFQSSFAPEEERRSASEIDLPEFNATRSGFLLQDEDEILPFFMAPSQVMHVQQYPHYHFSHLVPNFSRQFQWREFLAVAIAKKQLDDPAIQLFLKHALAQKNPACPPSLIPWLLPVLSDHTLIEMLEDEYFPPLIQVLCNLHAKSYTEHMPLFFDRLKTLPKEGLAKLCKGKHIYELEHFIKDMPEALVNAFIENSLVSSEEDENMTAEEKAELQRESPQITALLEAHKKAAPVLHMQRKQSGFSLGDHHATLYGSRRSSNAEEVAVSSATAATSLR